MSSTIVQVAVKRKIIPLADLLESRRGEICPACGRGKTSGHALCNPCFFKLPSKMHGPLVARSVLRDDYPELVQEAMKHLGALEFLLPQAEKIASMGIPV
jgi:hypothetical protein